MGAVLPSLRLHSLLLVSFLRVGLLGFGGGPSMLPLIQSEVVNARRWMTQRQFMDALAFGNALPGPITTKLAGYIGYRQAGWAGALTAVMGLTLPTIVGMVIVAATYFEHRDNPTVVGFMNGVRPVVIGLLMLVVWQFAPNAFGGERRRSLWLLAAAAFLASVVFGIHPALLILFGGVTGLLLRQQS